jgi:hypothetical protein
MAMMIIHTRILASPQHFKACYYRNVTELIRGAAQAGCVTKLNFLEATWGSAQLSYDLCAYAASSGSEEALRWLEEGTCCRQAQ